MALTLLANRVGPQAEQVQAAVMVASSDTHTNTCGGGGTRGRCDGHSAKKKAGLFVGGGDISAFPGLSGNEQVFTNESSPPCASVPPGPN